MTVVITAFAEYLFKFIVYIAVAALGIMLGMKARKFKSAKNKDK